MIKNCGFKLILHGSVIEKSNFRFQHQLIPRLKCNFLLTDVVGMSKEKLFGMCRNANTHETYFFFQSTKLRRTTEDRDS